MRTVLRAVATVGKTQVLLEEVKGGKKVRYQVDFYMDGVAGGTSFTFQGMRRAFKTWQRAVKWLIVTPAASRGMDASGDFRRHLANRRKRKESRGLKL